MPENPIASVLAGLRSQQAPVAGHEPTGFAGAMSGAKNAQGQSFMDVLSGGIHGVDQRLKTADNLQARFAAGDDVDLTEVTAATAEAGLAVDLLVQVRNKLVEALNEIMTRTTV